MKVEDRLLGTGAAVEDRAVVGVAQLFHERFGHEKKAAN